jgi:hypothetical protein
MRTSIILFVILILSCSGNLFPQTWTPTFVNTGGGTIYDLASNSSPQWIAQDPNTPDNIHMVIMSAPLGDPTTYPNRMTKYFFSSDRGVTWTFLSNVNERKSGFCSVMVASDGTAFICNHGSTNTNTSTRVLFYRDAFPGLGIFTIIDPPSNAFFFGRACLTSSITSPTKVILIAQNPLTIDTTFLRTGYPAWSAWTPFANCAPEGYCGARGQDGRIGITYIQNSSLTTDYKSVYFIETTNNGQSFSTPLKIYQAVFSGSGADSLAAFRGLAIAYKGNAPCVTFETVKQDPTGGSYFQKAPAKIRFWSSELPGSDPIRSIAIADQSNVLIPSPDSIKTGVNDQFGSLSRPVIGVSSDNNSVFVVFQAFTNRWGGTPPDTTNFKALYITKATGNYNFSKPFKFTPDSPLKDWSYPSISAWNDNSSSLLYANVCALRDSIPGNYPNSTNNGQSFAELYYIRLSTNHTIGINENQQTVLKYSLSQNFPNPFNPVTKIKFDIAPLLRGAGGVFTSLKIFDLLGKEIQTLVNEQLQPGSYEVTFDGSNFPSGVYFYQLKVGEFSETKNMLLIK